MTDKKRSGRTSLRKKIMLSSAAVLLLLATVMGSVSILNVSRLTDKDSKQILTQICEREALRFDSKLNAVQHAAEMIWQYSMDPVGYTGEKDFCSEEYLKYIMNFSLAIAAKTDGAMTVYFRNDPALVNGRGEGFMFSRDSDLDDFARVRLTDITAYDEDDIGHVGWFTMPKKTGRPLWMAPYYNLNLDTLMITYVIPLYREDGVFAGVIGMDIDFGTIMNEIRNMRIYETGTVAMADPANRLVYYMDEEDNVQSRTVTDTLSGSLAELGGTGALAGYTDDRGTRYVIAGKTLSNDMVMYVAVPREEINRNRNQLIVWCAVSTLVLFGLSVLILSRLTAGAVKPLKRLTGITARYAEGDWSEQYIAGTNDEIQDLSEGIAQMADNTQQYIARLNDLARKDSLTGLGNNTAYREAVLNVKKNRHEEFSAYAVVSMDLNELKKANDTLGHEAGNVLIREAAGLIARVFDHSPVFRTGGDEFTAILYTEDYLNRSGLLERFEKEQGYPVPGLGDIRLSVSFGMAEFPADGEDYDSVFELADWRMYQKKKEMKAKKA